MKIFKYKQFRENLSTHKGQKPGIKTTKVFYDIIKLLDSKKINDINEENHLIHLLKKISNKKINNTLYKNEPLILYALKNNNNPYRVFSALKNTGCIKNCSDTENNNLLMQVLRINYPVNSEFENSSYVYEDIVNSIIDSDPEFNFYQINKQGYNTIDLLARSFKDSSIPFFIYKLLNEKSEKILHPNQWNYFVFNVFNNFSSQIITDIEAAMKVDFWKKITKQTQIDSVFNRVLYANHHTKQTEIPYLKKLIDKLSIEDLTHPVSNNIQDNNTYYQKYIDSFFLGSNTYRFLSVESYMKKNKDEKEFDFKNYNKPQNILEASIYYPEVFKYIMLYKNINKFEENIFLDHIKHLKTIKLYDGFKTHFEMDEVEKICDNITLNHKTNIEQAKRTKRKIL